MLGWTKPQFKDDIEDGYDASLPYQMVPKLGKRYMMLRTGPLRVEMTVARGLSCGLTNFHVTWPFGKVVPELPKPGATVRTQVVPANTEVQFDIQAGAAPGHGFIDVHQLHPGGLKSPSPELQLLVSVKDRKTRNFLVCDLFDDIHNDIGVRARIEPAFAAAKRVFTEQANIAILKTDDVQVAIDGSTGATFDFQDKKLMRRVLKATKEKHGKDVFSNNTAVIFLIQVPIETTLKKDGKKHIPLGSSPTYLWQGKFHRTILLRPASATTDFLLPITLPHEMGHVMGLEHVPASVEAELPKDMPLPQKQAKAEQPWLHNLMFPAALFGSQRLMSFQIEHLHQTRPPILIINLDEED
jgi:hypothetical protein